MAVWEGLCQQGLPSVPCREGGVEETSLHWLTCQAYEGLRHGLDPEGELQGRIQDLRRVQELRKDLEARI